MNPHAPWFNSSWLSGKSTLRSWQSNAARAIEDAKFKAIEAERKSSSDIAVALSKSLLAMLIILGVSIYILLKFKRLLKTTAAHNKNIQSDAGERRFGFRSGLCSGAADVGRYV
jgi:hypothetical protein